MKRLFFVPIWVESAVAILFALAVSTAATVYIFRVEEQLRTTQASTELLFERVASATSAVQEVAADAKPELLAAFSRITRHITLNPSPIVEATAERDALGEARLGSLLPAALRKDVRVHPVSNSEAITLEQEFPNQLNEQQPVGRVSLALSIDVGSAGWINVRYRPVESQARIWPALISGLIAVGVALLATLWTRARFASPLQALTLAASALRRGEPVPSIPETGPITVRQAAQAFNAMSQRLTATLENQRAIMIAVAHDLRTPVAAMRLRAEFVKDEEERTRLLQKLDEMQMMTEGVLAAAQADRTGEIARRVDLTALVESLADDMREMGGDVTYEASPVVQCLCRTNEVRRAVRNLIENALRYGERARLCVAMDKQVATVHVDDDGPGIPEHQIDRMFEPFARLETSRSPSTGGYGLGLAIARWIARGHGGEVTLANRPGGGLRATFRLPVEG